MISISRSGRPAEYYCDESWSNDVTWIKHDMISEESLSSTSLSPSEISLPKIDAAISCIGNVNPDADLSGISFGRDRLFKENGSVNQNVVRVAKESGAERFVFLGVSYEVAKAFEGPAEGYMDGKRAAEQSAYDTFGSDNTIIIGPSLVYGGKRFSKLGRLYRAIVEFPLARAYVAGNDALRNLSAAPMEDWVEKAIFSSPVEVEKVARVAAAAALGLVGEGIVEDRRQGFFDSKGLPITYPNFSVYIDGTQNIEKVDKTLRNNFSFDLSRGTAKGNGSNKEPSNEGALIGKGPLLSPIPGVLIFLAIVYGIATNQFVSVAEQSIIT